MTPNNRRPAAANTNRPYAPAPYSGDGLEVIATLSHNTNRPDVLEAVAAWHEVPWRRTVRNSTIATALRQAARRGEERAA